MKPPSARLPISPAGVGRAFQPVQSLSLHARCDASMRMLAAYVGLCVWVILAQGLFPIYNTLLDIVLLIAALIPGAIMLARRRTGAMPLALGIGLSGAALISRFAARLIGLLRWDGHQATGLLCLAHFAAFLLAILLVLAIFMRHRFGARLVSAILFGFLLALASGIAAPDYLIDAELKYAIGQGIEARKMIEWVLSSEPILPKQRQAVNTKQGRTLLNLLRLPRLQLASLSNRFFDSSFADDARLIADLLLSPKPRDEALRDLEPLLLSRRLEFEIEGWTALKLARWRELFGSQDMSREMLFGVAERRLRAGELADAVAALNAVIMRGNGSDGARAINMLFSIHDDVLGDVEGGLLNMLRMLETVPEYVFLPAAQEAFGRLNDETRRRLQQIASNHADAEIRALAHLRLFFLATRASNEASASWHLDEVMRLPSGPLARLELGLRLYRRAERVGGAAAVQLLRAGMELCDGLEPPFLLLVSQLDVPAELADLPEIALRRLVALHADSIFWQDGLARLRALLLRQGRSREADGILVTHSRRIDLLSDDNVGGLL